MFWSFSCENCGACHTYWCIWHPSCSAFPKPCGWGAQAGLLIAETEFALQVESDIAPYKGLLMGLFFMTVGMEISFGLFFAKIRTVIAGILGLLIGKVATPLLPPRREKETCTKLGCLGPAWMKSRSKTNKMHRLLIGGRKNSESEY